MHDVLVRLVPEGSSTRDLVKLDQEMKAHGYRNSIDYWGGRTVPPGLYEYWIRTPASLAWIRLLATRMARKAGVHGRVAVTWVGERELDEAA